MGESSHIEWTDSTFNPWIGCTKVSPGCANCYAAVSTRARVLRAGGHETWGKGAPRSRTKTWGDPLKWNRAAGKAFDAYEHWQQAGAGFPWLHEIPRRPRVFCASLADWLDDEAPIDWLSDLLYLIVKCNHLDWQLLTKRPQLWRSRLQEVANNSDIGAMIATSWLEGNPPPNVWIGTTVEDQTRADERIPELLKIPAVVRFLSCEPLLGSVNLGDFRHSSQGEWKMDGFHWVICGGESGPKARPMHPDWARSLRDQCAGAGVPFLFKQHGEYISESDWHDAVFAEPIATGECKLEAHRFPDCRVVKVGKKKAGRRLDGVEHNGFPTGKEGA